MTQLFEALYGIFRMHLVRAEYFVALDVADRLVALAALSEDPELTVAASRAVGARSSTTGTTKAESLRVLQHAVATGAAHDAPGRRGPALNDVADAAITSEAYAAWTLWLQGRSREASSLSDDAVARSRALGHPFTLALALSFDSWLRQFQGDIPAVRARADEVWHLRHRPGLRLLARVGLDHAGLGDRGRGRRARRRGPDPTGSGRLAGDGLRARHQLLPLPAGRRAGPGRPHQQEGQFETLAESEKFGLEFEEHFCCRRPTGCVRSWSRPPTPTRPNRSSSTGPSRSPGAPGLGGARPTGRGDAQVAAGGGHSKLGPGGSPVRAAVLF